MAELHTSTSALTTQHCHDDSEPMNFFLALWSSGFKPDRSSASWAPSPSFPSTTVPWPSPHLRHLTPPCSRSSNSPGDQNLFSLITMLSVISVLCINSCRYSLTPFSNYWQNILLSEIQALKCQTKHTQRLVLLWHQYAIQVRMWAWNKDCRTFKSEIEVQLHNPVKVFPGRNAEGAHECDVLLLPCYAPHELQSNLLICVS